jgi:hypothetical protein
MPARMITLRLPQQLSDQLDTLCDTIQLSRSAAIRQSVAYMLSHPRLWVELLPLPTATPVMDTRTPAQAEAWEDARERLTAPLQMQL